MPKSAQYRVDWSSERAGYLLSGSEQGESPLSPDDGGHWLEWLEEHRAFAFHGRNGHCNLLKEKRRRGNEGYWYAYRRYEGRMLKRYVGRSEQVSMERLEEIATLLTREAEAGSLSASTAQSERPPL